MFEEALRLYGKTEASLKKGKKCGAPLADRTTFEELRKAFLPGRTLDLVEKPCDRIAGLAETMFGVNALRENNVEPSCSAVGLNARAGFEDSILERCSFSGEGKREGRAGDRLVCDCPDGFADYTAAQFARAHVVKCLDERTAEMYYSDFPARSLEQGLTEYVKAREQKDVSGMVLGCDRMVNSIHASGAMAKFFVRGGVATLDRLKEE